jgi:hypothetical protein
MSRLVKYSNGLLVKAGSLQRDANDIGEPDPGCCCVSCQGPCQWQPVWEIGTGEWAGGWELLTGCVPATPECTCPEPDVDSVGTEASPIQEYWETPCGPPGGCPPGGLCPCPGSGIQPLFDPGWPGALAIGPASIDCEAECQYTGGANGMFSCAETTGSCSWAVSICAQITCANIDPEDGCGSDCSLSGITVTVNTSSCACPDELPDYSGFNYFYCP